MPSVAENGENECDYVVLVVFVSVEIMTKFIFKNIPLLMALVYYLFAPERVK